MKRRTFLKNCTGLAAGLGLSGELSSLAAAQAGEARDSGNAIVVDTKPLFDISPYLYMQFMEPLGTTDSSVEASWSYDADDWRRDFIETSKDLAPDVVRFGGLFSRYYKWREGVGPVEKRPWMRNYVWGGKETNRVGTHEFVDYCRRIAAEPLYCVNFLSDGFQHYAHTREGNRTADAKEAAEWVSYANDPESSERKAHGYDQPYGIKLWQLGNETSYGKGGFTRDQSIAATLEFAKAMRKRDPAIQLIGWGDNGWAGELCKQAGEHLNYVAIHMMGQTPMRKDTVLNGFEYQNAPERAWEELMEMVHERVEKKLLALEAELDAHQSQLPIAITEGHLSLTPHNANPLLTEWLTGVYHARVLNLYQRHGDRVKICTAADFNGSRWTTNALILQVPGGVSYLLPAGAIMRLFKKHNGKQGLKVRTLPSSLDVAASRTGNKIFLHVANMDYSRAIDTTFAIDGMVVTGGRVFEIAPENPRQEISHKNPDVFKPRERVLAKEEILRWRFPARSVSAVELDCVPS
ncbi:alpha-L-arabinofuranosidase C-terminal domain-containing protein [Pedosphaera parvula]|uniref:Alpha-N-arabinofuranosidase n=1 Tax=Pedosphaera parvula (strain Ellin514) TaxID=320771 RepID=B9XB06_PEDPL|nr:alpha-L-arabinofuranosidase C-terminal domain-containing protein [Pedosphaera parvula]EEF63191.1 Alpha-N-arabinofuranosidase [Pedosphaera parvula Ellin514]